MNHIGFWVSAIIQGFVAIIVFIIIHELGHVSLARVFGDKSARFALVAKQNAKTIFAITFTQPFDRFTTAQNILIALGGVVTSRLFSEVVLLTKSLSHFQFVAPFFFTLFFLTRMDFFLYVVRNFTGSYLIRFEQGDQDISQAVGFVYQWCGLPKFWVFILFFFVTVVDLVLDWRRWASFFIL